MSTLDPTYELFVHAEETSVRGNAQATDNPEDDRATEDWILRQLNQGEEWAWCTVEVRACRGNAHASTYLGCCSYRNEVEFRESGYFDSMCEEALELLDARILKLMAAAKELYR